MTRARVPAVQRRFIRDICRWFAAAARPLPWREALNGSRDPYVSLVSEFMLQQTQVSRVLEKFGPFLGRFPTVRALAGADERDVLAVWSGLGYYRRARNLHAAAKAVVERFQGRVPEHVSELLALPGVGRYTAGAISSIVFGRAEPIVDGNVARVLLRVEGKPLGGQDATRWAWPRAEALVRLAVSSRRNPGVSPALFNEGLMELGALVCTPRTPRCPQCPVRAGCAAFAEGRQEDIPLAKPAAKRSPLFCASIVAVDTKGRLLVERRGDAGMWAGMWQAPTLESADRRATRAQVEEWAGVGGVSRRERFSHGTTHRKVEFEVWASPPPGTKTGTVWMTRQEVAGLGLSTPQRRILLGT